MDPNIDYTVQKHSLEVFHKKYILKNFTISTEKHLHQRHFLDKAASPKKGILENFAIFTGKHLRQSLFFNKVKACNFIKKETVAQVFSCEFCEISKSTFFTVHVWMTAPVFSPCLTGF